LSNQETKQIKAEQTKKTIKEFNKAVQKMTRKGKYLDSKNKKIEKMIQEKEKEIFKNTEDIQKLTQKKIKIHNFIFTLYRDLGENDKFNKFSRREFRSDSVGTKYIIYKIEFGVQSTTNPLKLGDGTCYNINDNGSDFIKDFIKFLKDHTNDEEKFYFDNYIIKREFA
jgi:hypothetical protein